MLSLRRRAAGLEGGPLLGRRRADGAVVPYSFAVTPLVSIVTPSYNMARFIGETIQSVLAQDYAPVEYIVMDGASTDGTQGILAKFGSRLRWVSRPDGGASDAIQQGFSMARGSILGWLSADDVYEPGAIRAAVDRLSGDSSLAAVYGRANWIDETGAVIASYPTGEFDANRLSRECFICQPACFFRREALEAAGGLDITLHYAFDYDLWIRMARHGGFAFVERPFARSRMHRNNKTIGSRENALRETISVLKRHYGYVPFEAVYALTCFLRDGRDQFFEPAVHSPLESLEALFRGCWMNRGHLFRYCADWWGSVIPAMHRTLS